jgi:predicted PurR-regulated permease PerM
MNRQRGFLVGMILFVSVLCALMLAPFTGYILAAAILGFMLYPAQQWIEDYIPATITSGVLVIATVLAAILPALIAIGFVAGDAATLAQNLDQQTVPALQDVETYIENIIGQDIDLRERVKTLVRSAASYIAGSASEIVQLAANVGIGISLMLFVQFYVLRDGETLVEWTRAFDIMPTDLQNRLYANTARTTRAVIKGHIFVAIAQGTIAGIGLFLTGIPNAAFWTFIMVLLAFIPLVGTLFVWVPAAIYLGLTGNVIAGIALFIWGGVIVGATDNFARPLLVDEDADIHDVFILTGIVGGTVLFGTIGIFVGPILFGVLKDLLELYRTSYDTL